MYKPLDSFKSITGWTIALAIVEVLIILLLTSCSQKYYRYSHSGEKFKVEHENQKR